MPSGRCLLFAGPELGERGDAVAELRSSLAAAAGGGDALEEHTLYAGESRIGDVVSLLQNGSLFSQSRLVLLKNAELVKRKDEVELLASYMAKPQDDTVLVLMSDETSIDKRLEASLSRNGKRIFWELFENRKAEWVRSFFRREGLSVSDDAVDTVLELVENNTDALRRECGRLCLFFEKGAALGQAEVESCLAHTREESAFTLFSRIADGDLERSLETARTLLASKEAPVQILAGLTWCFKRLGDYVALASSGRLSDFELRKAGLGSKKAQRDYAAAAKRYDAVAVESSVALLAEYDVLFRSAAGSLDPLLMELFLYRLVVHRGARLDLASFEDEAV